MITDTINRITVKGRTEQMQQKLNIDGDIDAAIFELASAVVLIGEALTEITEQNSDLQWQLNKLKRAMARIGE